MTSHCIGLVDAIAPQQVDCGLLDRTHHAAVFLLLEHANATPLCKPRTHPLSSFILSLLAPFYFGMVNCGGNTFQPVLVNAKSIDIVLQLLTCELVLVLVQLGQLHLHHACVCDWRLCLHQVCHHAKKIHIDSWQIGTLLWHHFVQLKIKARIRCDPLVKNLRLNGCHFQRKLFLQLFAEIDDQAGHFGQLLHMVSLWFSPGACLLLEVCNNSLKAQARGFWRSCTQPLPSLVRALEDKDWQDLFGGQVVIRERARFPAMLGSMACQKLQEVRWEMGHEVANCNSFGALQLHLPSHCAIESGNHLSGIFIAMLLQSLKNSNPSQQIGRAPNGATQRHPKIVEDLFLGTGQRNKVHKDLLTRLHDMGEVAHEGLFRAIIHPHVK